MPAVSRIESGGGVCAAREFVASGISAGLKESGAPDLAVILSRRPATVAAVFTTNLAAAAPVVVSREHAGSGSARGVVINSGCANACTGPAGLEDARQMARAAAAGLGVAPEEMLVCSTGLIGSRLPMDRVLAGIGRACAGLGPDDTGASQAIMTTDTVAKKAALTHPDGWSLGGIAKGAGMIAPDMATMLAVLTTDARVPAPLLRSCLKRAADLSFNAISVDGDTSTNDSLMLFANGASGIQPAAEELSQALEQVCGSLARQIVKDGEGATKLVTVTVEGARTGAEAAIAARTVAGSLLVKTMLFGQDANWGRIAAAVGRAGVQVDMAKLTIDICGIRLLDASGPASPAEVERARAALHRPEVSIRCHLASGKGSAQMLTTDLTPRYVTFNAEYEL